MIVQIRSICFEKRLYNSCTFVFEVLQESSTWFMLNKNILAILTAFLKTLILFFIDP